MGVAALVAATVAGGALLAPGGAVPAGVADSQPTRAFSLVYSVDIIEIPEGARHVQAWLPIPQTDEHQEITGLRVEAPIRHRLLRDPEYGNLILALEGDAPLPASVPIRLEADVRRHSQRADLTGAGDAASPGGKGVSRPPARYLEADRLVPIDGRIAEIARDVTKGRKTALDKARAIYDYVTGSMRYDKSGEGWGKGDATRACDVRTGNCSDFHALFIGLARAARIPARFQMGFPLPEGKPEGVIPGYHCWAEFFVPDRGWVPVDCSEASKNPERLEFYFGSLDPHRVRFTTGRDVQIEGLPEGNPLNFFIYPVVEVDGKPHEAVTREVRFADRHS